MSTINIEDISKEMITAAKASFGQHWPEIRDYAKPELKQVAEGIATINKLLLLRQISEQQASLLLEMKKNTAQIIMLSVKGTTQLMVEQAINAALEVVRGTVNKSLKFALL